MPYKALELKNISRMNTLEFHNLLFEKKEVISTKSLFFRDSLKNK